MTDPYKEEAELWQTAIELYSQRITKSMRIFGIEMTPDEARTMVLEELKTAVRLNLRELFLSKIKGKI